jgi:hypothetical protein
MMELTEKEPRVEKVLREQLRAERKMQESLWNRTFYSEKSNHIDVIIGTVFMQLDSPFRRQNHPVVPHSGAPHLARE